jgi:hypothetical protein
MAGESSPTGCLHPPWAPTTTSFLILPPGVLGGGDEGGDENGFDNPSIGPDRFGLDVEADADADAENNDAPNVSPGGRLPTELNRWRKNVARCGRQIIVLALSSDEVDIRLYAN